MTMWSRTLGQSLARQLRFTARQTHSLPRRAVLRAAPVWTQQSLVASSRSARSQYAAVGAVAATGFGLAFLGNSCRCDEPNTVLDELSGNVFPSSIQLPDNSRQTLIGLGTRTVTFVKFQVYTVGLYWDTTALSDVLSTAKDEPILSETFLKDILSPSVRRTIRLTPCRAADFNHLRDGFARAMMARVDQLTSDEADREAAVEEIQDFKRAFPKGTLELGEIMTFAVNNDSIRVEAKGELVFETKSKFLCEVLFRAYLDPKPVSTNTYASAQKDFAAFVAAL